MALTEEDKCWMSAQMRGVESRCRTADRTGLYIMVFMILINSCDGKWNITRDGDKTVIDNSGSSCSITNSVPPTAR